MTIDVICPGCKKRYRVEEKFLGKMLKCKKCGKAIAIVADGGGRAEVAEQEAVAAGAVGAPVLEYGKPGTFVPGIAPATSVVTTLLLGWIVVSVWMATNLREASRPPSEEMRFWSNIGGMVVAGVASGLLILLGRHLRRGGVAATVIVMSICGLAAVSILAFLALTVPTLVELRGWAPAMPVLELFGIVFVVYATPVVLGSRVLKGRKSGEFGIAPESRVLGCQVFEETFLLAVGIGAVAVRLRTVVGNPLVRNLKVSISTGTLGHFYGYYFWPHEQFWVAGLALVAGLLAWGIWRSRKKAEPAGLMRMGLWVGLAYLAIEVILFLPVLMPYMGVTGV